MMYVGTVVMDKQAEHRYLRVQSLTNREMSLKDEYDAIQDMLRKADQQEKEGDYDIVPVPK
jgi:chaperonin cofactor prefoldin